MASNNYMNDLGDRLKDVIDQAAASKDFSNLSNAIGNLMNDAIREAKSAVRDAGMGDRGSKVNYPQRTMQNWGQNESLTRHSKGGFSGKKLEFGPYSEFFANEVSKAGGIATVLLGGAGAAAFVSLALIAALGSALGVHTLPLAGFFGLLSLGSGLVIKLGVDKISLVERFKKMRKLAGHQLNIPIRNLANLTNSSIRQTVRDLKKMIDKGWFYEGHVDAEQGYFLLNDQAYQEYLDARTASLLQYNSELQKAREDAEEEEDIPKEVRGIIQDGRAYVNHIRDCNRNIPDLEITAKLDHMEVSVQRIFDEVKAHPEKASEMSRMMNYYLPTTAKLLDTYRELDLQPSAGVNIAGTKKEIADSLDVLNLAFDKFIDDLYAETAMDISTDVSVLNTILKQDGLKETDFGSKMNQLK